MKRLLAAAVAGALFGAGLVVSGMSNPVKVLSFLNIAGDWDPSLLVVMAAATGVTWLGYGLARRRARPLCGGAFTAPGTTGVDRRLVTGAVLFGVGWGITGYCPGPGLTALVTNPPEGLVFVAAMVAGVLAREVQRRRAQARAQAPV